MTRGGFWITEQEREIISLLARTYNLFNEVVVDGPSRDGDMNEVALYVHALQRMALGQAAARLFPSEFRVLGGTLAATEETQETEL